MARQKTTQKKSSGGRSKTSSRSNSDHMLFQMLKKDHDNVKNLFEQIQEDGEMEMEDREDLFSQIEQELEVHMEGEERFFYPALKESDEAQEKALEAYEEHHVTKTVLGEASDMDKDDERWEAKIKVLNELVEHHIQEEEGEIFKIAKKVLDQEQLQEIARRFQENKEEMMETEA